MSASERQYSQDQYHPPPQQQQQQHQHQYTPPPAQTETQRMHVLGSKDTLYEGVISAVILLAFILFTVYFISAMKRYLVQQWTAWRRNIPEAESTGRRHSTRSKNQ